jgi:hypothetical protein
MNQTLEDKKFLSFNKTNLTYEFHIKNYNFNRRNLGTNKPISKQTDVDKEKEGL